MFKFGRQARDTGNPQDTPPGDPQLIRLNRDFLSLLLHNQGGPHWPQFNLTQAQQAQLAACDETALQRMAANGLALFCLSLHQANRWQQLVQRAQQHTTSAPLPVDSVQAEAVRLLECALFYVWHLSQQNPQAGRLSLALADDTARLFTTLDIRQCQWLASHHLELLLPRWRHNPYFWNDLLRYGQTGGAQHFKFARLLGSQLIAQDLEPSAIARLSGND